MKIKQLIFGIKKKSGRNNSGKIMVYHRGGGNKLKKIILNRYQINTFNNTIGIVHMNNKCYYLVKDSLGHLYYINDSKNINKTRYISNFINRSENNIGNGVALGLLPNRTVVRNIEWHPGSAKRIATSTRAIKLSNKHGFTLIEMPSSEVRFISPLTMATVGTAIPFKKRHRNKAGYSRWNNKRPSVRGVAMNPVDHPNGGGEGKSKGNHPKSRTGILSKGYKTNRSKIKNKWIV